MIIALMNEVSQAPKNDIIYRELKRAADNNGHEVFNVGMMSDTETPVISYVHLGLAACILLNSKAVDFVVTGCGTGQGALISLNNYPGVICGYMIDPSDGYLFAQINNGNAVSLPYAKGFGWGGDLNLRYAFENLFSCERGLGYPPERREMQNKFAAWMNDVKATVNKDVMTILKTIDRTLLKDLTKNERFMDCLLNNSQVPEITEYVKAVAEE